MLHLSFLNISIFLLNYRLSIIRDETLLLDSESFYEVYMGIEAFSFNETRCKPHILENLGKIYIKLNN